MTTPGTVVRTVEHDGTARITFSADGTALASAGASVLMVSPLPSGLTRFTVAVDNARRTAFNPEATRLACAELSAVTMYDAADGRQVWRVESQTPRAFVLVASPDGSLLASRPGTRSRKVNILDAGSGALVHAIDCGELVRDMAWSSDGARLAVGTGAWCRPLPLRRRRRDHRSHVQPGQPLARARCRAGGRRPPQRSHARLTTGRTSRRTEGLPS